MILANLAPPPLRGLVGQRSNETSRQFWTISDRSPQPRTTSYASQSSGSQSRSSLQGSFFRQERWISDIDSVPASPSVASMPSSSSFDSHQLRYEVSHFYSLTRSCINIFLLRPPCIKTTKLGCLHHHLLFRRLPLVTPLVRLLPRLPRLPRLPPPDINTLTPSCNIFLLIPTPRPRRPRKKRS